MTYEILIFVAVTAFGILVYIGKILLKKIVENAVDTKSKAAMAKIESDLNARNEILRSQLEAQNVRTQKKLDAISDNRLARYVEADKRTLVAVESCWAEVLSLHKAETLVGILGNLNIDKVLRAGDPDLAPFFNVVATISGFPLDAKTAELPAPPIHRLYLSNRATKLYDALTGIYKYAELILLCMRAPEAGGKYIKPIEVNESVIELLPYTKSGYDKFGGQWSFHITSYLRTALFDELRSMIGGEEFKASSAIRFFEETVETHFEPSAKKIFDELPDDFKFNPGRDDGK